MNRSNIIRRLNQIEQNLVREQHRHINFEGEDVYIYNSDHVKLYKPSNTGRLFDQNNSFVQLVMGPYGSGKSTMCINKIVKLASQMPRWSHGRRKSRWGIIRNTSGELYTTTLQTWLAWFGELGTVVKRQKPLLTYEHSFNDGYGIIELELLFIALDREEDVRKIKSMELTGAYINEASEVPQAALSHLKGRVNHRYPSNSFCSEPYWSGIICDTNPPDEDHWIYRDFYDKPVDGYSLLQQPPGLLKNEDTGEWSQNPSCDNYEHLSPDYYPRLASGQTQDFIKVFCLGQFGLVGHGKLVYPEYNDDVHSVDHIDAIQGDPLHLGWDGGLDAACVVMQLTDRGRLLILKEYLSHGMGARNFAEYVLTQLKIDFPYCPKIASSVADPSAVKRDEIMAQFTFIGELNAIGIATSPANTNAIVPRISSVRFFLNKMIDGKSALLLDRKGCPTLRKGFVKDYVHRRVSIANEERYKDEPDKNFASHPHDALQYKALDFAADSLTDNAKTNRISVYNPVFSFS